MPNILIVDDEPRILLLLKNLLRANGFDVFTADGGPQALECFKKESIDVVNSDLRMLPMDGMSLFKEIKKISPHTPFILLTAYSSVETVVEATKAGLFAYMTKPFKVDEMLATLGRAVEHAKNNSVVVTVNADTPLKYPFENLVATDPLRPAQMTHSGNRADEKDSLPQLQPEAPVASRNPFEVVRPDSVHLYPYLVGGLLHDSLNTLTALQYHASELTKLSTGIPEPDALQRISGQVQSQLKHLKRVLELLQTVSREYYVKDPLAAHQPKEHVEEQLKNLQATYPAIRFHVSIPPAFNNTHMPVGILAFITGELLTNAARACTMAGEGDVWLTVDFLESGRTLSLECRDSGPGFPLSQLHQLLDGQIKPPVKLGTGGYGLYLIKEVVNRLQGSMMFSNVEPSGARVQVLLPNEEVPVAQHLQTEAPVAAPKPSAIIRPNDDHSYPYLVGGYLHDLINTYTVLDHNAYRLEKLATGTPKPADLHHVAKQLYRDLEHINRILILLQSVSQEYYPKDPLAVRQPKEHVEAQIKNLQATYSDVRLHASINPVFNETPLPVGMLAFVTGELLTNAARACNVSGKGEGKVSLTVDFLESGRTLSLECLDSGPGFPLALLDQLVDGQINPPDDFGKGGYGLYLIKEMKNRLQGSMLFSNVEPSGARVQVLLPVKGQNR